MQSQPHHVVLTGRYLLNAIHQAAHQEKTTAILAEEIPIEVRVYQTGFEVEARTFVLHFQDKRPVVDRGPDAHFLCHVLVVAAQDSVRQRLGQGDRHIEPARLGRKSVLGAAACDNPDDRFDKANVTGNSYVDGKAEVPKPAIGR